jgi:hypothetical protein
MRIQMPSYRCAVHAALALSLFAAGCTSMQVGRQFDYERFSSKVTTGTTDLAQVRGLLGEPMGKGLVAEADGSRYDQWTYYYGDGNMASPQKSRFKLLQIRFDQAGKVASYNWSGDLAGEPAAQSK